MQKNRVKLETGKPEDVNKPKSWCQIAEVFWGTKMGNSWVKVSLYHGYCGLQGLESKITIKLLLAVKEMKEISIFNSRFTWNSEEKN